MHDKKLCIICADDVYYNLETLKIVFQGLGLFNYCHFVSNGQAVIDCCQKNLYEVEEGDDLVTIVVIDYEMPMMTGLKAIKEIKALFNTVNSRILCNKKERFETGSKTGLREVRMPIFALFSCHQNKAFLHFCVERGVNHFLDKPPNPDQIFNIV